MYQDLKSAEYCGGYKIKIVFTDGKSGILDFIDYVERGGVFEKFRDLDFFKAFVIDSEIKTLVWGKEIDIAPEILYAKATQSALPSWMQIE